MEKKLFSLVLVASLAMPFMAGAQTSTSGGYGANGERQNLGDQVRELRDEAKQQLEQKRAEYEKDSEGRRDQFKKDMESLREAAKQKLEKAREAAKQKIEDIKDARKKETIKRLDQNLNEMNVRMLERYSANLNQLDKVLVNITARTDRAAAQGLVVIPVRTAIINASTSIAAARAAALAQSTKTYAAIITSSTTARADIAAIRDSLKNDLRVVEAAVKTARTAVHTAATTLATVPRIGETETRATTTQSTSTSQ